MRVLALTSFILCTCVALPISAQGNGNGQRAITFPDTLGANFEIADSARATSTPTDFDFLIGAWHFRFQQRNDDGRFAPPFDGHWFFEKKRAQNALIEDHWRSDSPSQTFDSGTFTYRTFNPERKIWEMQGVGVSSGAWEPGLMWADSANRYLIQHYGPVIMRIRYFAIQANHFLWRADMSADNGKTWRRDHWIMEASRIAR